MNPTRIESYIFVINLLQKGFKRGSGRHIIERTKKKKKERTQEQRRYRVTVITCSLQHLKSNS